MCLMLGKFMYTLFIPFLFYPELTWGSEMLSKLFRIIQWVNEDFNPVLSDFRAHVINHHVTYAMELSAMT